MVASLQCRCHLETATIKHRIERNDDQIEPFFDSIDPIRTTAIGKFNAKAEGEAS